jgi:sirohydrochlorin ferrochelatase
VSAAFLEFDGPTVAEALHWHRGSSPIVVPLLLTSAYHGRVDLPGVLEASGVEVTLSDVLGPAAHGDLPDARLVAALAGRVSELDPARSFDGLVLIAAGTSHIGARSTVDSVAAALSTVFHTQCRVGYASASGPDPAAAAASLRASGARRIVAASYFLAPGRLHDAAAASARFAGVLGVTAPLGATTELVDLILHRSRTAAASGRGSVRASASVGA